MFNKEVLMVDEIQDAVAAFERDGYYVARALMSPAQVGALVEFDRSITQPGPCASGI